MYYLRREREGGEGRETEREREKKKERGVAVKGVGEEEGCQGQQGLLRVHYR